MAKSGQHNVVDPVDLHVGETLRRLRRERSLSQTAIAASIGVTFQQVQKYELGTNRISASAMYGIARRMVVPISAFFEGLPDPALGESGQES